jgi:hypothetical protein
VCGAGVGSSWSEEVKRVSVCVLYVLVIKY